jgi:chromosome segregation ATPase
MADDQTKQMNGDKTPHEQIMARFDAMDVRFDAVDARLSALEAESQDRKRETRPIWERALAEILALGEQMKETNLRLAEMNESFGILGGELLALKGKQRHLETRVRSLEGDHQPQ